MRASGDLAQERLLIQRCQKGERDAFDLLFAQYEKRVYNLSYRLSGNYDEANDISVDAFLRVYQAIKLFRGDANFSTWLYRIVTNVYLDRRKRQRNKQHLSLEEYIELEENSVARQVEDPNPGPAMVMVGDRAFADQRFAEAAGMQFLGVRPRGEVDETWMRWPAVADRLLALTGA